MGQAQVIDGKKVAASLRSGIASRVSALAEQHGIQPGHAVILVGD